MSISTKSLIIKAVGIVVDDRIEEKGNLGKGVAVNWLWNGKKEIAITAEMYKNNVFNNTLYEEYFPEIQMLVLDLALNKLNDKQLERI